MSALSQDYVVIVFPAMMVLSHYLEDCYSWQAFCHLHKGVVIFIHLVI